MATAISGISGLTVAGIRALATADIALTTAEI